MEHANELARQIDEHLSSGEHGLAAEAADKLYIWIARGGALPDAASLQLILLGIRNVHLREAGIGVVLPKRP